MNAELAWMVAIFWIGRKPGCEVSMASASQTVRTALEGLIWRFPDIGMHSSGVLALNARPSKVLRQRWGWLRPQFRDEPQNLLEHKFSASRPSHSSEGFVASRNEFCSRKHAVRPTMG